MKKQWIAIDVACEAELAEELAATIAEAFEIGVEITETGVRFYLEGDYLVSRQKEQLQGALDEFAKIHDIPYRFTYAISPLEQEDWADRWKVHFKPLRVGGRFLVCPTWEEPNPLPEDMVIWMDPGRAFGTGHHESTRLCLEWLEKLADAEDKAAFGSFLDVGTGSGILAIAAALLGFKQITAIDNDPEAIEVAKENVDLNGIASTIRLQEGVAADLSGQFDVIIANIQALPLIAMAQDLTSRLKQAGTLALSGILVEQRESVVEAYEKRGVRLVGAQAAGEWSLLEFSLGEGKDNGKS